MIAKKHLKRGIAQLMALVAIVVLLGAMALAGKIALYSLSGAQTSQALNEVPEVPEDAEDHVTWLPDRWTQDRKLEPGTRRQVEAAYVQVWEALGRYPETGDRSQVEQWFAGPARQRVLDVEPALRREVWAVDFKLALTFYSLDGATLALRDEGSTVVRSLQTEHGETIVTSLESYDSVLTLEDGYWRVRQLRRVRSQPLVEVGAAAATARSPRARAQTLVNLVNPVPAHRPLPIPDGLVGVDLPIDWIAPVEAGTDGTPAQPATYDRVQLEQDLQAATAAGLKSVRITVPEKTFGEVPSEEGLLLVRSVLDRAQAHGLRVEVTIDPAGTDREPRAWTQADTRLTAVVGALADHPALVLWNLYQSPELAPTADVQLRAWLVRAALAIRTLDPATPVTIGWQTPAAAADPAMIRMVDVVTVPWQGRTALLDGWLNQIGGMADGRTLRLAPTAHSWNGIWPGGRTEAEQAAWTAAVIRSASSHQVTSLLTGPLRDSTVTPPSLLPWVAGPATHTGLLRSDGTPKPVAATLSPVTAAGWPIEKRSDVLHKPFWRLSALLVLLSVPGLRSQLWRRIRPSSSRDQVPSPDQASSGDQPSSGDQAELPAVEDTDQEEVSPLLRVQAPRSGAHAPVPRLMAPGRLVPALVADQRVVHRAPADDLTDFVPLHPAMAPIPAQPTWFEPGPVGRPSRPVPAPAIPLPTTGPTTGPISAPDSGPISTGSMSNEAEPAPKIPARRPAFGWRIGWSLGRIIGRTAQGFRRPGRG